MASLPDRVILVTEAAFAARVAMAAVIVSIGVVREPTATPFRPQRASLASSVLSDPIAQGRRLAAVVLADDGLSNQAFARPTDASAIAALDTAIITRLRDTWNVCAGVTEPPETTA